jgi:hypothetical protein
MNSMYLEFRCKKTRITKALFGIAAYCGHCPQLRAKRTTCGSILAACLSGCNRPEALIKYCYNNCYMCKNPIVSTEELRA